jgi:GDP-L-fucose synthase
MKILVTGGTSNLSGSLKKIGFDAVYLEGRNDIDLSDYNSLFERIRDINPKWIIHTASKVGGIKSNMNHPFDYLYDNILINTNIFRAAKELKVPRFTAVLSTCVYPVMEDSYYPLSESNILVGDPEKTNRGYAISKRVLGEMIDLHNLEYGSKYNYIIPCNLFGNGDHYDPDKTHFLTSLLYKTAKAVIEGENKIEMFGTGKVLRQFVTYDDLARVIVEMVQKDVTSSFNFAPPYNLSLVEYAKIAEHLTDNKISITFNGEGPDGIFRKDADNSIMKKLFPTYNFEDLMDSMRKTYNFYLNNDNI